MLQQDEPGDYVIATGELHSVRRARRDRVRARRARLAGRTCGSTTRCSAARRSCTISSVTPRRPASASAGSRRVGFDELVALLVDAAVDVSGYVPLSERPHRAHAKLLAAVGHRQARARRRLLVRLPRPSRSPSAARRSSGIELDPDAAREAQAFCEHVLVGDVETMELPLEPRVLRRRPAAATSSSTCATRSRRSRRLRRFLQPGGRLVLSTPNVANWAIRPRSSPAAGATPTGGSSTARTRTSSRARPSSETLERAGYRIVALDFTVPVPGASDRLDALAWPSAPPPGSSPTSSYRPNSS